MSDGEPRPLLCYSRRRRRHADDDADDLCASPGDRAVRPRANPDTADAASEAPPSGGTPRRPRASVRAPPPVPHAPDDSASTSRRGLVTLSRLGAGSAPAPAPPQLGAAHAPPGPGAATALPRPALGAWSVPFRPWLQPPGAGPSTTGPLEPAAASHPRPRSVAAPAAPVTPVAIIPRAGQRGTTPSRPGVGTGKVPNDNTPRDVSTWKGIRQSANLPVCCMHGDIPARGMDEIRRSLINSLSHSYVEAVSKLPMDDMPELLSCVLSAGHAYGVLEPVNNIIVNAINYHHTRGKYSGRRIDTTVHDPQYWIGSAKKSLQGLVVFLRSYFWCLSEEQALGYLYLSNADPVLAVGLVERDQNVECSFHQVSTRTESAILLAAHAATHPNPGDVARKMTGCFLSTSIVTLRMWLRQTKLRKIAVLEIFKLFKGYMKGFDSEDGKTLYSLRTVRYDSFDIVQLKSKQRRQEGLSLDASECSYIRMLKLMILDGNLKVCQVDAISRLSSEAVSILHRGLVVAGHPCGFFEIPAYNVIVNAIWYTWAFPEEEDNKREADSPVSLLCSDRMFHVSKQSLDGSIAFLQAKYSKSCMSKHEAIEFFYGAKCILADADKLAYSSGHTISCGNKTALEAAVSAMGYMWLDGALCLVDALESGLGAQIQNYLWNIKGAISVAVVNYITNMLSQRLAHPLTSLPSLVSPLSAPAKAILAEGKRNFLSRQSLLENKLKDLLDSDEKTKELELHSICGAVRHLSKSSKFYHVNFWAVKKGNHKGMVQKGCLFFAEIWVTPRDDHESSLRKLTVGAKGRCFCCELNGNKVWHPINVLYEGLQEEEFANFLDSVWTRAQKAKRNMDSDLFYFNSRTDPIVAERLIEARESESDCLEYL